jgi:hypothetical protein
MSEKWTAEQIPDQVGHPKVVRPVRAGRDETTAQRLWSVSEELTGVSYSFGAPSAA